MRKVTLLFMAVSLALGSLQAQTYYTENFNSNTTLGAMPTGFVEWNDANALNATITTNYSTFNNSAWIVRGATGANPYVVSCSDFTVPAIADRWLVTPKITIASGSTNVLLTFDVGNYGIVTGETDTLEVLASTTDSLQTSFTTKVWTSSPNGITNAISTAGVQTIAAALPANLIGQNIRLAFRNHTLGAGIIFLDNIKVFSAPSYDIGTLSLLAYEHYAVGSNITITGVQTNSSFNTITDMHMNYSINGAAPVVDAQTGLTFTPYSSRIYSCATPWSPAAGIYTVKIWADNLNGVNVDNNHANDTITKTIFVYTNAAVKNVVLEEFTSTGCGYCPEGGLVNDYIVATYPNVIGVTIHNGDQNGTSQTGVNLGGTTTFTDQMVTADSKAMHDLYDQGNPTAMIDRVFYLDRQTNDPDRGQWENESVARLAMPTPVTVSIDTVAYDTTSRRATVRVSSKFLSNVTGDLRFNLYVIEDSVNHGALYSQHNYYSTSRGAGNSASTSFAYTAVLATQADPIVGWQHRTVLRRMMDGSWGGTGVIPNAPVVGTKYSKTYTVTIPAAWDATKISLVGLVQEYNTDQNWRYILNADQRKMIKTVIGINAPNATVNNVSIYPNPTSNLAKIEFDLVNDANVKVTLTNVLGQQVADVYNGTLNSGSHTITCKTGNIANGLYFVKVEANGSTSTYRLVVSK